MGVCTCLGPQHYALYLNMSCLCGLKQLEGTFAHMQSCAWWDYSVLICAYICVKLCAWLKLLQYGNMLMYVLICVLCSSCCYEMKTLTQKV